MALTAPHLGDSSAPGWNPFDWAKPILFHSASAVSEEKWAGVDMASPASLGGVGGPSPLPALEGTGCMAFMWLQLVDCTAVLGKLFLNLTPLLVTNGLISSINFHF